MTWQKIFGDLWPHISQERITFEFSRADWTNIGEIKMG